MGTHRSVVCLAVLTTFLAIVCAALLGILIWREFFTDSTAQVEDSSFTTFNPNNLTEIQQKFPGYFRTPKEQERLEPGGNQFRQVGNVSAVYRRCFTNGYCERSSVSAPTTTTLSPTGGNGARRRRQVSLSSQCALDEIDEEQLTFHGCCVSYSDIINPTTLPTAEPGQRGDVNIAQFGALKQYFEIQQCCQAQNCTGCQCAQTYYVVSAVVGRRSNQGTLYRVEYVRVPGCCKCLNTFPEKDRLSSQ